mgnify:FL=1|tara:strand:+ start:50905 stop:51522 length:618 start_codon:yes stop_codon:yes gene_type:complete
MIAIIDYGVGNLRSVHNAVNFITPKKKSIVTNDPDQVIKADKIIFPGQGAMPGCVKELEKRGLKEVLIESAKQKPFLGICLGLQMLFDISDEGNQKGFGLLPGKVTKFKNDYKDRIKIPHMGWNSVMQSNEHPMWRNIKSGSKFYFVHSYFAQPTDKKMVVGETEHGENFVSAVAKDNIFACQFHPEKSAVIGLKLLENFISWEN